MNTWLNEFLFRVHPLVILVILISVKGVYNELSYE